MLAVTRWLTVLGWLAATTGTLIAEKPKDPNTAEKISFTRQVLPVLSRLGCNSGACHGAQAGKGGFRLSLNGYNPRGDHFQITRQARGRRIEMQDPGRSLLLTKPTGAVPHKGGLRLEPDSENYRLLADWIARGAAGPEPDEAGLERLEVSPSFDSVQPGESVQLQVVAHYGDGTQRDVTAWSRFSSSLEPVIQVDDTGRVKVLGSGEAAVVVWFSSQLELARFQVPFDHPLPDQLFQTDASTSWIDRRVLEKLKQLQLRPASRCDDATFVRRVSVDTIGMLPTVTEVREFLADDSPDKRMRLVDELLQRDEFVDYWTYRWSDMLLINGRRLRPQAVKAYYEWIRDNVAQNRPWDELVRELVTAQGGSLENGATNFYALHQTPEEMAENVSQAFLGLSIGCAKCHNHPLEKWTNDQYYAMANLFARVRAKGWGGDGRNGDGVRTLVLASQGELVQPLTGKPQPPTPLDGQPLAFDDPRDRREHLANWLTAPENPYFSRSIANRVWAALMGRGLVEEVDDMRISNPASNEPLLAEMAQRLTEQKFDLKWLMREILLSDAYQRSSETLPENRADDRFYSRYVPRRMMAEVLLDAMSQVTQVPTPFDRIQMDGADVQKTSAYPLGTRSLELYDSAVRSPFLATFGRNNRDIVCECERSNQPSMGQVLHIANGTTLNQKLGDPASCVQRWLEKSQQANWEPEQLIEEAYLACFARLPKPQERDQLVEVLQNVPQDERRAAIEDLYWSLMSSREFLFQH